MTQNSEILTLSRKEREKKGRQEEILNAARLLFSQKGYHETTLEEIAHKAEFAKGTIYNYFANKDELFYGIVDSIFEALNTIASETMAAEGVDLRQKFMLYTKRVMQFAREHADLFKILMREGPRPAPGEMEKRMLEIHRRDDEAREYLAQALERGMEEGTLRRVDARQSALVFDGMLKFFCMHHVKHADAVHESDIERAAALIVTIFFDGIQLT